MAEPTESSELLKADLFASVEDGMLLIDPDYTMIKVNTAFEAMYPELMPLVGKKCYETSDIDYICPSCPAALMFETGKSASVIHYEKPRGSKSEIWFDHSAHPVYSASGKIIGACCFVRDITEQKNKENTLKRYYDQFGGFVEEQTQGGLRKESEIHTIITEGSVPILFASTEGKIEFANAAFLALTGYAEHELHQLPLIDKIIDPQTAADPQFKRKRTAFYKGEIDQFRHDVRIQCKTGESRWMDFTAFAVKGVNNERNLLIVILLDITERYRMVRAVEEANEQTQIMLDSTPLGCTLLDWNCRVIDCNMAALKLFGIHHKEEYCNRFFELSPEFQPDGSRTEEKIKEHFDALEHVETLHFEWLHQTLTGEPIPSEITLNRIKRGDSHIVAGYSRDLREIKKYEALREQDRQRTNALLELAEMAQQPEQEIVDFVIKSIVSLTNSTMGYVVLLEHAKDTLPFRSLILDKSFSCSLPTTTSTGLSHTLSATLTECLTIRKAVIHDDLMALPGERAFPVGHIPVHAHMNFPLMDDDKPIGIIGVGNKRTPYTETDTKQLTLLAQGLENLLNRKKYAESLEQSKDEAEKANKAKSNFLAHMSHEIRTPLNGVIGLSDLLAGTPLDEKQREYVQLINISGNTLLFLINDILDFSKIEAGKLEIECEPFDLAATIETVLASLVSRTSSKSLELAVSFFKNMPKILQGDAGRIRQVLLNLAGNAVKFTDKGGIRIDVTLESIVGTTLTLRFSVIDTGIGIPKSGIERLFKAFSQVDTSSARIYGGTGLGLAISLQLVRLMKGEIGVASTEGKGSTFWFTLPFECTPKLIQCLQKEDCFDKKCIHIDGHACLAFVNREMGTAYKTDERSVLIVDDNEVQREAIRIQLRNWKMNCVTCTSMEEAIRLSQERWKWETPFELFVIDSTLDDGTGIDLTQKLFELDKVHGKTSGMQVILLRSISDHFDLNTVDESRLEIITKPVVSSTLFNAVMDRIFAAEKQRSVDSGILSSSEFDERMARLKSPKRSKSVRKPLNSIDHLKSYLAGKVHVLIVEDNRVNQIVAKNILAEAGFTCDVVSNGNEACSAVRNKMYDVVLMDCQMPEMDGFEATDLIRNWEREQNKKRLPVIALTANAVKEDIQRCFDSGMDAYCSKPINPLVLIQMIEEWYERTNNDQYPRT